MSNAFQANLTQRKSARNKGFGLYSRQLRYFFQSLVEPRFETKSRGRAKALNLLRFERYYERTVVGHAASTPQRKARLRAVGGA